MNLARCAPVVAAFLLVSSLAARGQQPSDVFTERVEVLVVNVEVFVTDKDGNPVSGLTPEDFVVLEDGKPVEVTNFYTAQVKGPGGQEPHPSTPEPGPDEDRPAPRQERGAVADEQRLHLLVYVDNLNTQPTNRQRVLDSLDGFLEDRAALGERIMLVVYDRGIDVVQPFTDNRELIAAGLKKIRKSRSGPTEEVRLRLAARNIERTLSDPVLAPTAADHLTSYIQETRFNLLRSTRAVRSVVRSMAGLPGRKMFLYVSDGLPKHPGAELAEAYFGQPGGAAENQGGGGLLSPTALPALDEYSGQDVTMTETNLFNEVVREANAQQVTFYSLDARGSTGSSSVSAERSGSFNRAAFDAARTLNLQAPLMDMSLPTGGGAFLNTYNFESALTKMAADMDSYYSLGFRPSQPGDGRYHRIEVKVQRPGLKVRHRSGYLHKPPNEVMGDRTYASLLVGVDKNPLGIGLQFDRPEKKRGHYLLPCLVRIPMRELTLLSQDGTAQGRLRIYLIVQDEKGDVSDLQEIPYPVSFPGDQMARARQNDVGYTVQLKTRGGTQKIAVGVLDEYAGVESFTQEVVLVGKANKKAGGG